MCGGWDETARIGVIEEPAVRSLGALSREREICMSSVLDEKREALKTEAETLHLIQ